MRKTPYIDREGTEQKRFYSYHSRAEYGQERANKSRGVFIERDSERERRKKLIDKEGRKRERLTRTHTFNN